MTDRRQLTLSARVNWVLNIYDESPEVTNRIYAADQFAADFPYMSGPAICAMKVELRQAATKGRDEFKAALNSVVAEALRQPAEPVPPPEGGSPVYW